MNMTDCALLAKFARVALFAITISCGIIVVSAVAVEFVLTGETTVGVRIAVLIVFCVREDSRSLRFRRWAHNRTANSRDAEFSPMGERFTATTPILKTTSHLKIIEEKFVTAATCGFKPLINILTGQTKKSVSIWQGVHTPAIRRGQACEHESVLVPRL